LGRLDFFESALAFMAGYGLKSFLISQSLNQIEKAYGANNSILDNCHVRVAFATNDERTAKRVSDALGTATELRAMKNYAGHRLSPWLGHLMVSRSETARPLLTPGEVMQLPPQDELVMVSGLSPIRATKVRYFEDRRLATRVRPAPKEKVTFTVTDDWYALPTIPFAPTSATPAPKATSRAADTEGPVQLQHAPEYAPPRKRKDRSPETLELDLQPRPPLVDEHLAKLRNLDQSQAQIARQASLDPGDDMGV